MPFGAGRTSCKKPALEYPKDVTASTDVSCADCHGGDRASDDAEIAMSVAHGFKGKPRAERRMPQLCARCHSDVGLMRRYSPRERVISTRCIRPACTEADRFGDEAAATCIDCHSVHDIRAVKTSSRPSIRCGCPRRAPGCHSDAARMAKYKIPTKPVRGVPAERGIGSAGKRRDFRRRVRLLPRQTMGDAAAGFLVAAVCAGLPRDDGGPLRQEPAPTSSPHEPGRLRGVHSNPRP